MDERVPKSLRRPESVLYIDFDIGCARGCPVAFSILGCTNWTLAVVLIKEEGDR